jgi:hypothetical protein
MTVGLVLLGAGLALLAVGKVLTQRAIESAFGKLDNETISKSTGAGVVPVSVSLVVLFAWAIVLVGAIATVLALL